MSTPESAPEITAPKPRARGPWIARVAINVLTIVMGVLILWLHGFIVDDIGSVKGPDYEAIVGRHLDSDLLAREEVLARQISETKRSVEKQNRKQKLLSQSSHGLQKTMGQLLELQKLSLERKLALSADQSKAFNDSLKVFLSNQERFQDINEEVSILVDRQLALEDEQDTIQRSLDEQRKPALEEYGELTEAHRKRLAMLKLVVLAPLFILGIWLLLRMRGHSYFPLVLAFAGATTLKTLLVMHEHFPQRWFKYLLILILLIAAARLLVYFIRSIVAPKKDKLLRQYRDGYEKFLCPVCEFPIRRGPMKFLYWNRRSLKKLRLPALSGVEKCSDGPYTCPSCSTELFSECPSCHSVRSTLLPFCEHCSESSDIPPA